MSLMAIIEEIDKLQEMYSKEMDPDKLRWLENEMDSLREQMHQIQCKDKGKRTQTYYWKIFYKVQELLLANAKHKYKHSLSGSELPRLTADVDLLTRIITEADDRSADNARLLKSGKAFIAITAIIDKEHPAAFLIEEDEEHMISIDDFLQYIIEEGNEERIQKYINLESEGVEQVVLIRGW